MASWRERLLERADAARRRAAGIDLEQLQREEEAESSGFFAGFALGVVVGAILALVFAPLKGEQTREFVAERAVQLKDRATDLVAQARGDAAETAPDDEPAIEREVDEAAERASGAPE